MALLLAVFFCLMAVITVVLFVFKVWWLPELASVHGQAIDDQLILTLIVAGAVFFLAQVGLGYFIWKYREREGQRPLYWHENPKLEATWTILTAVLFVGIAIQGNRVWAAYFQRPVPPDALTVEVTGQQFAWNIRYAGADGKFGRTATKLIDDANANYLGLDDSDPATADDIATQNLMAVPVNRPVRVLLKTKDVTHAFYVPQLRVKQDAVPGMSITAQFTATKTGEYEIACAELCGMQHYKMRGRLLVMEPAEFEGWLKQRAAR